MSTAATPTTSWKPRGRQSAGFLLLTNHDLTTLGKALPRLPKIPMFTD
jgi:hypothetical protein